MAINQVGSNVSSINTDNNIEKVNNSNQKVEASANQTASLPLPGSSPKDGLFNASLLKTKIDTLLAPSRTETTQAAAPLAATTLSTPALNPRGTFQQPLNNFLANIFRIPTTAINNAQSSIAVNSANQFQNAEVVFNGGGTLRLFNNLPPSNPFPPQTTAQIPRIYLDGPGVLSFARTMQPLNDTQRNAIANLYAVDQQSRRNYGVNVQNLASALTQIKNTSLLDAQTTQLVNSTITSLGTAYNQIANYGGRAPNPDTLYKQVATTLQALTNKPGVNQNSVNTALNVLGIGYSNYLANRLPIGNTNNPTPTTAAALPTFNAAKPLSQAQGNPGAVFGNNLLSYLRTLGITGVDPGQIQYQVNSADKLQAATVRIPGSDQTATFFFNGQFPVTSASPAQIQFSGSRGTRDYTRVANADPGTQQRLSTFYQNNAQPRANYVANLNNLITGFQTLRGTNNPTVDRLVSTLVSQLQTAVNGLNANPPRVPDVLGLYKQVGQTLDFVSFFGADTFNAGQLQALDTINRSTFPIGITNYFARPVSLTQPS